MDKILQRNSKFPLFGDYNISSGFIRFSGSAYDTLCFGREMKVTQMDVFKIDDG